MRILLIPSAEIAALSTSAPSFNVTLPPAVITIEPSTVLISVKTISSVSLISIAPLTVDLPLTISAIVVLIAFVLPTAPVALKLNTFAVMLLLLSTSSIAPAVAVKLTSPCVPAWIVSTSIELPSSVMSLVLLLVVDKTFWAVMPPLAVTSIAPFAVVRLLKISSPTPCRLMSPAPVKNAVTLLPSARSSLPFTFAPIPF